jgi:hypothetical protein
MRAPGRRSLAVTALLALAPVAPAQCWTPTGFTASDPGAYKAYGWGLTFDSEWCVVGSPGTGLGFVSGSVYIRSANAIPAYSQTHKLIPSSSAGGASFGNSVDLSGTLLAASASKDGTLGLDAGAVYLYERDLPTPDAWGELVKRTASDGAAGDEFGEEVSLDGDLLAVGAPLHDGQGIDAGAAYVFHRNKNGANQWGELAQLLASSGATLDEFGYSLSQSGNTLAVAAPGSSASASTGQVYVYERNLGGPNAWGEVVVLAPFDGASGDRFGFDVALCGDDLLVGAPYHDGVGVDAGAAYVYRRDEGGANNWGFVTKLIYPGTIAGDLYGMSVDLEGQRAIIGAVGEDWNGFSGSGAAHVFDRNPALGTWSEVALITDATVKNFEYLGRQVALHEGNWMVGAPFKSMSSNSVTGKVWLYEGSAGSSSYCTAGTTASGCQATLSSVGYSSASAPSGFDLVAVDVEGNKSGLFFYSANGQQAASWGNGSSYQCVVPPVRRGELLAGSGTPGACDGAFSYDLNARWTTKPGHNPGAGASVSAQLWFRDPQNTSNQPTSLSDALTLTVCP